MKYFQALLFSLAFNCSMIAQANTLQAIEGNGAQSEVGLFIDNTGSVGLAIVNCHRTAAFFATRSSSVEPALVIEHKNGTGDFADIRLNGSRIIESDKDMLLSIDSNMDNQSEDPNFFGIIRGDKANPVFTVDQDGRVVADGNIIGKQLTGGSVNESLPDLLLTGSNAIIKTNSFNTNMKMESNGDITFRVGQFNGSNISKFSILDNSLDPAFSVDENGNTRVYTVLVTSDRNKKDNISDVSPKKEKKKLVEMPIYKWKYKKKDRQHIGPMAQDFFAAFELGNDETTISSIDADGVSLSAIKGLYQLTQEELAKRDRLIEQLSARLLILEQGK